MRPQIKQYDRNLYVVEHGNEVDIDSIQTNLNYLADIGICTFGNINTEILAPILTENKFNIVKNDLCYEDDLSLGLQMPDTWYINRGVYAISIAMYYNFINYKEMAKSNELFLKNRIAFDQFGRTGIIEIYLQNKLEKFLVENEMDYFGVPNTLTECMRVLEGWDIKRVPRLRSYVPYSEFIKLWSKDYFPDFNETEWNLGEKMSKNLFDQSGTTNVRESIKYFWKNFLLSKSPKISHGDIEIDILNKSFFNNRKPDFILMGEDIFSTTELSQLIHFKEFTTGKIISVGHSNEKNEKDLATAYLTQKLFPDTKIIVFRNSHPLFNFTMCKLDEIKHGISREVGIIAQTLCSFIQEFKFEYEKK